MTTMTWIDDHAQHRPDHPAIIEAESGRVRSYRELAERIARATAGLLARGVKPGDRVGIVGLNTVEYVEALYACARIGAIAVPINYRLSVREVAGLAADCSPVLVLADTELAELSSALSGDGAVPIITWGDSPQWEELLAAHPPLASPSAVSPHDPWLIIYTSGTTGRPKGVVHSVATMTCDIENSATASRIDATSTGLGFLAPFHVAGLNVHGNPLLRAGGTQVLMARFDARRALELLASPDFRFTHFSAPSAALQMMTAITDFDFTTLPPIITTVGGSPIPEDLLTRWQNHGWTMVPVYGATEAGSSVASGIAQRGQAPGWVGPATAHTRLRVVDAAGTDCAPGELGEVWIGGESLMLRYWQQPAETDDALVDGWYRTGDIGALDDAGELRIVDRVKDMFISGAENVYPAEVESVLFEHPAVGVVAVVGVPDEKWGEVGMAFVVLKDGHEATAEELRTWCDGRLARYKIPAHFRFVPDLPRGGSGKVLKNELVAALHD